LLPAALIVACGIEDESQAACLPPAVLDGMASTKLVGYIRGQPGQKQHRSSHVSPDTVPGWCLLSSFSMTGPIIPTLHL
jgi:hypothetical protein